MALLTLTASPVDAERTFGVSASAHFITHNADATGVTILLAEGIRPDLGASLEFTRITEEGDRVELAAARLSKLLMERDQAQLWTFGGARYVRGNSPLLGDFDALAASVGLSTSVLLAPEIRLDAGAGFSFFKNTLTEASLAVSRKVTPEVLVSAGYKQYRTGGEMIGGPTVSITWRR